MTETNKKTVKTARDAARRCWNHFLNLPVEKEEDVRSGGEAVYDIAGDIKLYMAAVAEHCLELAGSASGYDEAMVRMRDYVKEIRQSRVRTLEIPLKEELPIGED